VLAEHGYDDDASTLPTFIGPLARAYYFFTSKLPPEEKAKRNKLFGTWREVMRPLRPYTWDLDGKKLTEIPVTTMPLFRAPIHLSYVLYLALFSPALALLYFRCAMFLCKALGTPPSILLHPLDFLGADDAPELAFFPGMGMPLSRKLEVVTASLKILADSFDVVPLGEFCRRETSYSTRLRRA
jgi:hypothetical protein